MNMDAANNNNIDTQHQHQQHKDLTEEGEMNMTKSCKEVIESQKDQRDDLPQSSSTRSHSNTIEHLKHHNHHHHHHSSTLSSSSNNSNDPMTMLKSTMMQKCENDPNLGVES